MDRLQIFKAGTHISANGTEHTFTVDDLAAAARAYSAEHHEAPLVVGHPTDNGPAYGWVKGITITEDGAVEIEPDQVDPDFQELVRKGRYKKISASWYLPDSPVNPVPGTYYLRHVGFLGAQPPAIKGLRDASFNESDSDFIEFEEDAYRAGTLARMFRGLRELLLGSGEFSAEDVDRALPGYAVEDLEAAARDAMAAEMQTSQYSEQGDTDMDKEALKAAQDKLAADQAELDKREQALADKEAQFAERDKKIRRDELSGWVDKKISEGKILPAHKEQVLAFMESLADSSVEFGEGEAKTSQLDAYKAEVDGRKPLVDFKEKSADDGHTGDGEMDQQELAQRAVNYRESQAAKGIVISATQAVNHVRQGLDKASA